MSLWYCECHGMHGPSAVCPNASHVGEVMGQTPVSPAAPAVPPKEAWRPFPGHDGIEISDTGKVRSWRVRGSNFGSRAENPRVMATPVDRGGYLRFVDHGKTCWVHRAVLLTFVGPAPLGCGARHLNGTRTDNRLANLAWGTRKENEADKRRHGTFGKGGRKLTDENAREAKRMLAAGKTRSSVARHFGVHSETIGHMARGKTWKHVTLDEALTR